MSITAQKDGVEAPATGALARYRWVILFSTWTVFLLSYIDRVAWSSVAAPVGQSLGLPVALLGAFVTAFYAGYVIGNLAGGALTDAIGARRALALTLVPLGIATFAFGQIQSFLPGLFIQFAMGFAAGADYTASIKLLAAWFTRDRGFAMGMFSTATSLAVVISNASVPRIATAYGWQVAFEILGLASFAWAIFCFFAVRDTPGKAVPQRITRAEVLALFRNKSLLLVSIGGFGGFWATVGFAAWGNALMTRRYGISPIEAGSVLATFGLGAIVAKPVLGWLRDWLGGRSRKLLPIVCLLAFSVMLMVFAQCSTVLEFDLVAPILGATAFGYTPLLYVLVTEASAESSTGSSSGLANAIWQVGGTLSPLAVGLVFSATQSFEFALGTLAIGRSAARVCCASSRPRPPRGMSCQ
jgi:sugar phosphate permease